MTEPQVQFMIRVKLPNSSGYASCPSGDTDYAVDYAKAMKEAVPQGFIPIDPRPGHRWPVDTEGFTFVPLKLVVDHMPLEYWINRFNQLALRYEAFRDLVRKALEQA